MYWFRKIFRVYAHTLVFFASLHLLVIAWYAITHRQWRLLQIGEIWDVRYISPDYTGAVLVEIVFAVIILVVIRYYWVRDKDV